VDQVLKKHGGIDISETLGKNKSRKIWTWLSCTITRV
jgi:hypothetical protein